MSGGRTWKNKVTEPDTAYVQLFTVDDDRHVVCVQYPAFFLYDEQEKLPKGLYVYRYTLSKRTWEVQKQGQCVYLPILERDVPKEILLYRMLLGG